MLELKERHCAVPTSDTRPMNEEEMSRYMELLGGTWKIAEPARLVNSYPFENFKRGMAFAQEVGLIAEKEQHHPDICIGYDEVEISLRTHAIGGLSPNDFIMAAKIESL